MKYIINMLAKPESVTTTQTGIGTPEAAVELYLKNSLVCFSSVRMHNPGEDIKFLLFVNWEMSEGWREKLEKVGVELILLPFGKFSISDSFAWSIVQYRYDVMEYLAGHYNDEDVMLMLDTDVYCVGSLDPLFEDMGDRLMFFDTQHDCMNKERKDILDNAEKIYGERRYFTHWGGEFIGCKNRLMKKLMAACAKVLEDSRKAKDLVNFNDEHITSAAVDRNDDLVAVPANAYIFRYWTLKRFYLVSTNFAYNKTVLWHLPNEKKRTMIFLYDYYMKNGSFPDDEYVERMLGFPGARPRNTLARLRAVIREKRYGR